VSKVASLQVMNEPVRKITNLARGAVLTLSVVALIFVGMRFTRSPDIDPKCKMEENPESYVHKRPSHDEWLAAKPGRTPLAKELGGDDVLDVLANPDRGSASRVHGNEWTLCEQPSLRWSSLNDLPTIAGPFIIAPDTLSRIAAALSADSTYQMLWTLNASDNTYEQRGAKMCEPFYNVRLRLEKGSHVVDVYLCYGCHHLQAILDGKPLAHTEFGPGEARLIAIAQALFPDDPLILSLKPRASSLHAHPQGSR
jgi:hypothetical protein